MTADSILEVIESYSMLETGDRVAVGLSGGADSVCLLSVLCRLKPKYKLDIVAAHVNHGIRGEEADRDESFCKELCEKLGVPLEVLHADIPSLAKENGEGLEECGRRVRYEFFNSLAGGGGKIAVAHNMNDVAETLIFNLTRGTSLKGAGSIAPVRDNVIRPLLFTKRAEIEEYLSENSLAYVSDSTNYENDYARNKIRNLVMPVLSQINPNAVSALASFSEGARSDEAYIGLVSDKFYEKTVSGNVLDRDMFVLYELPVKKRIARKYIASFTDADVLSKHIDDFLAFAQSGEALQSAGGVRFVKRNGVILPFEKYAEPFCIDFCRKSCELSYPYGKISVRISDRKDLQILNKDLFAKCADCDKISDNLKLRSRKEGDRITLVKRGVTKTLKKLFNEDGIAVETRNTVPVIDSDGEVVWVKGYGVSKQFAVDKNTEKVLIITCE